MFLLSFVVVQCSIDVFFFVVHVDWSVVVVRVGLFFQAEDGIRDLVRSRGLGDVYKRQDLHLVLDHHIADLRDLGTTIGSGSESETITPDHLSLIHI